MKFGQQMHGLLDQELDHIEFDDQNDTPNSLGIDF